MSTVQDDAIALYLQRIRPYDLVILRSQVVHDYEMLVGSFASYVELIETLLPSLTLSDDIHRDVTKDCAAIRRNLDAHPALMAWYANELPSMTPEQYLTCLGHDLRLPISTFRGYAGLLAYELNAYLSASDVNQRAWHLIEALQSTADRMIVVLSACQMALQLHRTAS